MVRVYQEDWWPFQNLPHALKEFERQTGIKTELSWDKVGVGLIEGMFEHMIHSFTDDDPPYDLICTDEVMLRRFAAEGRVLLLNDLLARDWVTLDDVTAETRRAVTLDGQVIGLPCCNVSNFLLYRRDLLERSLAPGAAKLGRAEGHWTETAERLFAATERRISMPSQHAERGRGALRLECQQLPRIVRRALAFR